MKHFQHLFAQIIIALALIAAVQSCGDSADPLGLNLYSTSDDRKMGDELDAEIVKNTAEYPIYSNTTATAYVQAIADAIKLSPEIKYATIFSYKVKIIKNDTVVNAFAIPGGYVYVYTGLLKFLDNEASLASVIGHEIAHAECRHATKRMTKQYGMQYLLQLLLGSSPGELETIAANLFSNLALLKNSRDDEYEADAYSFKYLRSTNWYPGAMTYFFDKVKGNEESSFLATMLSTHPLSQDRIDAVKALIAEAKLSAPTEANLRSTEYTNFKKLLTK